MISVFLSAPDNWRILLDLTMIGLFGGIYIVPLYTYVQHMSETRIRSRIIAANNILNALFMVISALITIALISMGMSIPEIFLGMSFLNILIVGLISWRNPQILKRFLNLLRRAMGQKVLSEDL